MPRSPSMSLMVAEHRLKRLVKPLLVSDQTKALTIKGCSGRRRRPVERRWLACALR